MAVDPSRVDPGLPAVDTASAPDAAAARRILALLRDDDVDAAIEAGLAGFVPLDELDDAFNTMLLAARDRLLAAWAARERHRARARRLERVADERRRARSLPPPSIAGRAEAADAGTPVAAARPPLPPAAAAALARARARASGRDS